MKKEFKTHYLFLLGYFLFVILLRRWFDLSAVEFVLGGAIGILLPYVDHFIYAYFLRPQEAISLQAVQMVAQRNYKGAFEYLITTRRQQTKLVFHTAYFQLIFLALTFLVITSSGSVFGRGLVLAFALHLFVDQVMDLKQIKNLQTWFTELPIALDEQQRHWYLVGNGIVFLLFGLYF